MNDQERLDDLIIDGLQLYQRTDMFRFSFDAIALIHFCRFNGRHTYVDLGTGTGVMPLIGRALILIRLSLSWLNVVLNTIINKMW